MGSNNGNDTVNLFNHIQNVQDIENEQVFTPRLHGVRVTPDISHCSVSTKITPVCVLQRGSTGANGNPKKYIWYCLATHNVSITLPDPYKNADGTKDRSALRLGTITITVDYDNPSKKAHHYYYANGGQEVHLPTHQLPGSIQHTEPPKSNSKITSVKCIHAGPGPTSSSQEISNSVSYDLGANVGIFGNMPTAGVSGSYSISNSVSSTLHDVAIMNNSTKDRGSKWVFTFANFDSEAGRSNFDYKVQGIWEFETEDGLLLEQMPFLISVEWVPRAWWVLGNNKKGSEDNCESMSFQSRASIGQSQVPQEIGGQASETDP